MKVYTNVKLNNDFCRSVLSGVIYSMNDPRKCVDLSYILDDLESKIEGSEQMIVVNNRCIPLCFEVLRSFESSTGQPLNVWVGEDCFSFDLEEIEDDRL